MAAALLSSQSIALGGKPRQTRRVVRPRSHPRGAVVVVRAASSSNDDDDRRDLSRRGLLSSAAMAAAMTAAVPIDGSSVPFAVPAAFAAAGDGASTLPLVPATPNALKYSKVVPSQVIKGCWQLGGGHRGDPATDRTSGASAVEDFKAFYEAGITTFDTVTPGPSVHLYETGPEACGYGPSELIIGEALKSGAVRRQDVQIFTKLCCVGREQTNMTKEWVNQRIDLPCRRLGVDSIDLVQMYWNDYSLKGYVDAALFLTDLKHAGKIKAVGLTNFDTKRVAEMVDAGAEIATNQIQYSLLDRRPEKTMAPYFRDNGIGLLPYGVVAGGLLSDKYLSVNGADITLDTSSKRKYASVLGYAGGYGWFQSLLQELKRVGDKHGGVSVANVAARWVLDSEVVPSVILGARNANHVEDHRALFAFDLDAEDRAAIRAVLDAGKQPTADSYQWERGGQW